MQDDADESHVPPACAHPVAGSVNPPVPPVVEVTHAVPFQYWPEGQEVFVVEAGEVTHALPSQY